MGRERIGSIIMSTRGPSDIYVERLNNVGRHTVSKSRWHVFQNKYNYDIFIYLYI